MDAHTSPLEVLRHTFWAGSEPLETDGRQMHIAACIEETIPTLLRLNKTYSNRQIMWALIAIIVDIALDDNDAEMTAAMLRSNARLLELQSGTDLFGSMRRPR